MYLRRFRIFSVYALVVLLIGLSAGCNKDDIKEGDQQETGHPKEIKNGVWSDCLSREADAKSGILMRINGGDAEFAAFTFDHTKPVFNTGSVTYNSETGTGRISVPAPIKYNGEYGFAMLSEDVMQCIAPTQDGADTLCFKYMGTSIEEWFKDGKANVPQVSFNPAWACMKNYGFNTKIDAGIDIEKWQKPQTKGGALDNFFGWTGVVGSVCGVITGIGSSLGWGGPSNQDIMDEVLKVEGICNEMNGKINVISDQLTDLARDVNDGLNAITKELATIEKKQYLQLQLTYMSEVQNRIQHRNEEMDVLYSQSLGAHLKYIEKCYNASVEASDSTEYFMNLYDELSLWMGDGDTYLNRILSFITYLYDTTSPDGGDKGMPYIYDRLMQITSAWEHETFESRLTMYLSDASVVFELARWTSAYLQCCVRLDKRTNGQGDPEHYIKQLESRCSAFSKEYEKRNGNIATAIEEDRRVCYIYNAQFMTYDSKVEPIDYKSHPWAKDIWKTFDMSRTDNVNDEVAKLCLYGFKKTDNGYMDPEITFRKLMPMAVVDGLKEFYHPADNPETFDYLAMFNNDCQIEINPDCFYLLSDTQNKRATALGANKSYYSVYESIPYDNEWESRITCYYYIMRSHTHNDWYQLFMVAWKGGCSRGTNNNYLSREDWGETLEPHKQMCCILVE